MYDNCDLITILFIVAEYLGEKLAAFFGITTPRYQYVIDEFYRLKAQVSVTLQIQKVYKQSFDHGSVEQDSGILKLTICVQCISSFCNESAMCTCSKIRRNCSR